MSLKKLNEVARAHSKRKSPPKEDIIAIEPDSAPMDESVDPSELSHDEHIDKIHSKVKEIDTHLSKLRERK